MKNQTAKVDIITKGKQNIQVTGGYLKTYTPVNESRPNFRARMSMGNGIFHDWSFRTVNAPAAKKRVDCMVSLLSSTTSREWKVDFCRAIPQ